MMSAQFGYFGFTPTTDDVYNDLNLSRFFNFWLVAVPLSLLAEFAQLEGQ